MIGLGPPPLWLPPKPAIVRAGRIERAPLPVEAVLPGLAPVLARRAVGNAITTITFVASAGANAATITIPAGAQAGDVAVLFDLAHSTSVAAAPTSVTPANWTLIKETNEAVSRGSRAITSYKILAAGEPGSSVTGMNDDREDKVMLVFRGNVAVVTVTPSVWNGESTDGDPASQSVAASGGAAPLVVLGCAGDDNSNASFATASPAFDGTGTATDLDAIMGYKIYNSAPADHTIDMADLGSNNALHSGYLQFSA